MSNETQPNCTTRLLVVIVNYRTPELTINSLHSLVGEVRSLPGIRVVVVDNDSDDNSVEQISTAIATKGWGDWASLLPSKHNGGYAFGNNLAIRPTLQSPHPPDFFLLLNPDTLVRPNAIQALLDFMQQHPQAGLAGSSFEGIDGRPWPIAFRFPSLLSELEAGLRLGCISHLLSHWVVAQTMPEDKPSQVDWVPGASLIVRREVFEAIGLMDEEYFLYFEETDFCLQAKRAGWQCWYVPSSRIMHIAGQSTGVTGRGIPKRRPKYWFNSRRRFFIKNYGILYAALTDALWISGFSLWRLRRIIQRKPDSDPPQFLSDFCRNSTLLNPFPHLD